MTERLFRGDDRERAQPRRQNFDPIAEGKRHGLSPEVSLALWRHSCREATDDTGLCDEDRARVRFAELAERIAKRGGHLGPAPFKYTRVEMAASGVAAVGYQIADPVPGRTTQVLAHVSGRARVGLSTKPGCSTLVSGETDAGGCTPDDSRAFFQRYVGGGHAALFKLACAIASQDRHAAVLATIALQRDLRCARTHLANRHVQDEELAALERAAGQLLATVPVEWRETIDSAAGAQAHDHASSGVVQPIETRDPVRLPAPMLERMEHAFGQRFDDVEICVDSAEVPAGQQALARDQHIYLEPGAVDLETWHGERVIAHERAHVVQQRGGGARIATRQELEREATQAAATASRGQTVRIALRAEPAAAYAFSESAEHEDGADLAYDDHTDAGEADAPEPDTAQPASAHGDATIASGTKQDDAAMVPASEVAAPHGDPVGETSVAQVKDASAIVLAEESPASAPAIGSGAAIAKPPMEPSNVATAKPEDGLAQLCGVQLDRLGPVLGEAHTAASADIARARATLHANPPKQMSTGTAPGSKGANSAVGAPKGAAPKKTAPKEAVPEHAPPTAAATTARANAERPVKVEIPEAEAAKQTAQGAATEQQKTAGDAITSIAHMIAAWFSSWGGSWFGHTGDASAARMSDEESRQMAGSVERIPTTADGVSTNTGPAPALAMRGEARTSADRDRAAFETKAAALENQSRADSRDPMGEDHIEPTAPPEELTAVPLIAVNPTPAATLPTLASASSEEVGIIAQEQHGAEIDAALAKASTDVTAERAKHADQEAQVRAESDAEVRALKAKADVDQAAARDAAQAEVQTARGQWQAEIDRKGADARKQADRKVVEGLAQVEAEEAKANTEAKRHIEEGNQKAEHEKQKGEQAAAGAKEKVKHKSSGFWGWVSSKAKAAFDGVKKAVSFAIDACRRAVQAVIEGAKKLAMAAIELARKAIHAAIKAIGQALIAISDVLLATFPELKARFQRVIRRTVDRAIAAVNKLADGLKQAVQKALDKLGAALDQALQLFENGINVIINAANAVVQGAIKAAQAVVDMLGTWAKLIKDIATGPGAWIGKLGAAIVDGIKNHLWSAFKTAAIEWFKSKVFELLGIGGVILQLLLDGGLTKDGIIQMALDALIVAIPAALVAILVEKLVALIVPAVGALMAIIEGLQAAWGTISRIIAAFGAFMAFLLAVKGGGAGALFAAVLAGAAVVVLDFVGNWLLTRLASAARKVGAKLKGLAEKFKNRRKGKDKHKEPPKKDHDEKVETTKADKDQENRERLDKAIHALQPKVGSLLQSGVFKYRLRAQLLLWRAQYRLTALQIEGTEAQPRVIAKVNPEGEVQKGLCLTRDELLSLARKVAEREVLRRQSPVPQKVQQVLHQETPKWGTLSIDQVGTMPDGAPVLARESQRSGHTNALVYRDLHGETKELGTYPKILETIQSMGMSDKGFAGHMVEFVKTERLPAALASNAEHASFAGALKMLMFRREAVRNPMALLTAPMELEMVASGSLSWADLFTGNPVHNPGKRSEWGGGGTDPMSMIKAPAAARRTYKQFGMEYPVPDQDKLETSRGTAEQAEELQKREKDMLLRWLNAKAEDKGQALVFHDKQTAEFAITRLLIKLCREWYDKQLAPPTRRR